MTERDRPAGGDGEEREYVLRLRTPDEPSQDLAQEGWVRVLVEEVSLHEPSTVVAEVAAGPGPTGATLTVRAVLRPRREYSVRVHVDRGGDGAVRAGDLVGAARLDAGTPSSQRVDVHLTRVLDEPAD